MGLSSSRDIEEALDKVVNQQNKLMRTVELLSRDNKKLSDEVRQLKIKVEALLHELGERDCQLKMVGLERDELARKCKSMQERLDKIDAIA